MKRILAGLVLCAASSAVLFQNCSNGFKRATFNSLSSSEQVVKQNDADEGKIYQDIFLSHSQAVLNNGRFPGTDLFASILKTDGSNLSTDVDCDAENYENILYGYVNGVRRACGGSNLFFHSPLLRMLYYYSGKPGQDAVTAYFKAYRSETDQKMAGFCGLLPHGNHIYYSVVEGKFIHTAHEKDDGETRNKIYHEINDYYGDFAATLPILNEIDPEWFEHYAQAIWDEHVFHNGDMKRYGQWDRHNHTATDGRRDDDGSSWASGYAHAGSAFIHVFTFMASTVKGRDAAKFAMWRDRAKAIRDYMWSKKHQIDPTDLNKGALVPLLSRRDMGRLNPYSKKLGWKKADWAATGIALGSDGKVQVYVDADQCTDEGYTKFNLPMILRDPGSAEKGWILNHNIVQNSMPIGSMWKVCTLTTEVPAFWVPALVEAGKVFEDPSWMDQARLIMLGYHKRALVDHVADDGKTVTDVYAYQHTLCNKPGCTFDTWQKAKDAQKETGGDHQAGMSPPDNMPVSKFWDTDPSGEDSALMIYRGYTALMKADVKCKFCLEDMRKIAAAIDFVGGDKKAYPVVKIKKRGEKDYHSIRDQGTFAWIYAEALEALMDLDDMELKNKTPSYAENRIYLKQAQGVADEAIEKLYDPNTGILRGHHLAGYEAFMGSDSLALSLLKLSQKNPAR